MHQRTEQEIMKNWEGNINKPIVSICCITYNHENYIGEALDGFLMQETNFPFEVLVNDDCSTDNTAKIIKEYEKKYPNIIKPIYQKENQYSKGVKINPTFNFPRSKGEYIAMCEGDDYWTDSRKLQLQVNKMELNNNIYISFHKAYEYDCQTEQKYIVAQYKEEDCIVDIKDNLRGRGMFMPTASMIFRNRNLEELLFLFKQCDAPIGDFFIQAFFSLKGEVLYLNEAFSVYRRNAIGSWTESQQNNDKKKIYNHTMAKSILCFYRSFKESKKVKFLYIPYTFYEFNYALSQNGYIKKVIFILKGIPLNTKSIYFIFGYFFEIIDVIAKKIVGKNK